MRKLNLLVLSLEADRPLVVLSGQKELREDYFDALHGFFEFYDVMLCGGEPYGRWF